jgi:hypothetical protein
MRFRSGQLVLAHEKWLSPSAPSPISEESMRLWITILIVATAGTAFGRLGDTENQLKARYGRPVLVVPGEKSNPYFTKVIDFQKEGISISCGIHDGRCVTIKYERDSGFTSMEVEGFTLLNRFDSPVLIERTATSLNYTLKKDYPGIVNGSKKALRKMRKAYESVEQKS